jgi:uncharacterized membrane protein
VRRLRWEPIVTTLLCVAGLGVSTYLTITHFDKKALVCSGGGVIDCAKVTTSPQSEIFGIPVAFLGLFFFVPMLVLCLPRAWASANRLVHLARLALSITGVGMILYLITAELFVIKAICLWCSSVHLITFILFVIIATTSPKVLSPPASDPDEEDWADDWPADVEEGPRQADESYQGV